MTKHQKFQRGIPAGITHLVGMGLALMIWAGFPGEARAHIGSPNAIFEGLAGNIPVRVIVRPPGVVPGLADIDVRVFTNGVRKVTVLPVHWRAGVAGSPPPDECLPVVGDPELFHAQLWLMARGAYSVNVHVETERGSGKVIVPVNSLATTRLAMPKGLGTVLGALGVFLFLLAVSAVGAAVRESVLDPGMEVSRRRVWLGRLGVVVAMLVIGLGLWGGSVWWGAVDGDYRNHQMYRPVTARAETRLDSGARVLSLYVDATNSGSTAWSPLVPDHGKLMHMFLVREPGMDAFAHLHPVRRASRQFDVVLPPLPAGTYRAYADVTHESGFSQTLTTAVEIPAAGTTGEGPADLPADPEDSWSSGGVATNGVASLGDGLTMKLAVDEPLRAGHGVTLRVQVRDASGAAAKLEPYISMLAHAAIRRDDGTVFTHLHPAGSISMASQQVFQIRSGEKGARRVTPELLEQLCAPPGPDALLQPVAFPYEFPKPGHYRMWVQVKSGGAVHTGVFDLEVAAK